MRKNRKILLLAIFAMTLIIIPSLLDNQRNAKYLFNNKNTKNKNVLNYFSAGNHVLYEWNRTWGGSGDDGGYGVKVDSADNVYLAGTTESFGIGSSDMALVKYNSFGKQLWNRTWGGSNADIAYGVTVDSSDNVYIAGHTFSFGKGWDDMVLVKYDSSGVWQWNRTWGGIYNEDCYGVAVDSSDNVYLAGETGTFGVAGSSDMVLVKYDSSGMQLWNRTWGGSDGDGSPADVVVDSSDNVYLAGRTISFGEGLDDIVLVKYDSSGVQQWNRTWGGATYDYCNEITIDSSDNIYLTGYSDGFGVGLCMVLMKYDSSGEQQWNCTWDGGSADIGMGVTVDSSDNVYLSGVSNSFGAGGWDFVLVKYDSSGMQLWNRTWGGATLDHCTGVTTDSSDNVYLSGFTNSFGAGGYDMILVKFNMIIINIITPENIMYSGPMNGYYPATYGFENDNNGDDPEGWIIEDETAGNIEVVGEIMGHKKVLKLPDYGSQSLILHQPFDHYRTNGTVEFWILSEDANERNVIHIGDANAGNPWEHSCSIWFAREGKIQLHNGSDFIDVYSNLQSNEWYHLRIEFDLTDDWHLWLNGEQLDTGGFAFRGSPSSMTQLRFGSQTTPTPVAYFDAVGYSWDPNYHIGDNLYEGLLLSYDTNIDLDWWGYSLDSQNNVPILGNTTIPMPEDGPHTIQIFGNSYFGIEYQSEIRHFTIDYPMELITPESKIYSGPMSGYYPATYGFECDSDGDDPKGWIIEDETAGNIEVVGEIMGHKKVLKLPDYGIQSLILHQPFDHYRINGTVEFWILSEDANERTVIYIGDANAGNPWEHSCSIWFARDGKIQLHNGSDFIDVYSNLQSNEWYHLRIEFDLTDDWHLWLNGEQLDTGGYAFRGSPSSMTQLRIGSQTTPTPVAYFDAVGYSWDSNYHIGDNLNEGLLLSFENHTVLEWIGYSLDGQSNRPILGNITFPLPEDGPHTIKIFGNDSLGTIFHSNIRHFLVDTIYPEIKIISPSQNEFFGKTAPNFEITLEEFNLHSTWYSLDGGITNFTFSGLIGTIDQSEWDKKGDGSVIIRFYVNDTGGLESFIEIQVLKDGTPPISSLIFIPHSETEIVNKSTIFTLIANDGAGSGISVIRYKINESSWNDYSGPFNLSSLDYGYYNISFYSIDQVGNIEDINSFMVHLVEIPSPPPPDILIFIIIGVVVGGIAIAIIITIALRKRK